MEHRLIEMSAVAIDPLVEEVARSLDARALRSNFPLVPQSPAEMEVLSPLKTLPELSELMKRCTACSLTSLVQSGVSCMEVLVEDGPAKWGESALDAVAYAGGAGDFDDLFKVISDLRKTETEYHQFDAYMDSMSTSGGSALKIKRVCDLNDVDS